MNVRIIPGRACGTLCAPPSKSAAHRLLICGALSGNSTIGGLELSEDILATLDCLSALGYEFDLDGSNSAEVFFHEHGEKRRKIGILRRFFIRTNRHLPELES